MSATEELRRLLDERGVGHFELGGVTEFVGSNGRICRTYTRPEPITVDVAIIAAKPEQAVEATLGRGTCHDEGDPSDFCCSECGVRMFTNTSDTYTMIASDERTIIKRPNYCPNCGSKVVK